MSTLLAIESSCDDTGAAVIKDGKILSNVVSSQSIHQKYGGVVPELASRAHQTNIVPVVDTALQQAKVSKNELNAVAFTQGPGLLGSLLVGTSFAKSMAMALGIPLIAVDHLQAHLAAHFIDDPKPKFPFLCLLVSGGHTLLVLMQSPMQYEIIGRSMDDAAGEAFDKGAKILGLPYPGGPLIDKYAQSGDANRFKFTQPEVQGFDYSFSGLKTAFLYFLRDQIKKEPDFIQKELNDICASYQYSIVKYLLYQFEKAAKTYNVHHIGIAGGVAANSLLRSEIHTMATRNSMEVYIPSFEYCTDNAAMIAKAAEFKYEAGLFSTQDVIPYPRQIF